MPAKYIALVVFIWVAGSLLGAVMEQAQLGPDEEGVLQNVLVWQQVTSEESWGFMEIVGFIPRFFTALFNMLIFNFAFITGPWVYFRWIVLAPIIAIVVYGLIINLVGIFQKVLS